MTSQPKAKALFLEALEKELAQRAAYLDLACADDPALQQRVEALLRASSKLNILFAHRLIAGAAPAANAPTHRSRSAAWPGSERGDTRGGVCLRHILGGVAQNSFFLRKSNDGCEGGLDRRPQAGGCPPKE
jgi:hypothetical protein